MRIARFISGGKIHTGKMIDDKSALRIEGDLFGSHRVTDQRLAIDKLLAPLVPTDILCIGLNYREHAKESNSEIPKNPMLFIKASNTLNNPFDPIPLPRRSSEIDYECETRSRLSQPRHHTSADYRCDFLKVFTRQAQV